MGLCYAARRELESALFWFEKAVALHPGLYLVQHRPTFLVYCFVLHMFHIYCFSFLNLLFKRCSLLWGSFFFAVLYSSLFFPISFIPFPCPRKNSLSLFWMKFVLLNFDNNYLNFCLWTLQIFQNRPLRNYPSDDVLLFCRLSGISKPWNRWLFYLNLVRVVQLESNIMWRFVRLQVEEDLFDVYAMFVLQKIAHEKGNVEDDEKWSYKC